MSIYQIAKPKKHIPITHKKKSRYALFLIDCWEKNKQPLTNETNNPNFLEIVDNCKNCVPYDTKRHDSNRIGNIRSI